MNDINLELQDTPNTDMEVQEQADIEFNLSEVPVMVSDDYIKLINKPSINGVTLQGNKTSNDLGLVAKETGKGLSSNDFTNTLKSKLEGVEEGATKVDKTSDITNDSGFINKDVNNLSYYRTSSSQDAIDNQIKDDIDAIEDDIDNIDELIPSQATSQNQLADKNFVNSSIATNTAYHRGTFDIVNDLELPRTATHLQVATALASKIIEVTNNDYAFVSVPNEVITSQVERYDRYKYVGVNIPYEVPSKYSPVKYFRNTGLEYLVLNLSCNKTETIEFGININSQMLNVGNTTLISSYFAGAPNRYLINVINNVNAIFLEYEFITRNTTLNQIIKNEDCILKISPTKISMSNGVENYETSLTRNGTMAQITLFGTNTTASKIDTKIRFVKKYDANNNLIAYYVPLIKQSTNEKGYYDLINNVFATNNTCATLEFEPYQAWQYEFTLNNSSFTANQWATITSGLSSSDKTKIDGIENGAQANDLEGVQVGGVDLPIDANKKVNVPVAEANELGVIQGGAYGFNVNEYGYPIGVTLLKAVYDIANALTFISKGTLENVMDAILCRADKVQALTDAQKTQARANIGTQKIWKGTTDPTPQIVSEMAEGDIYVVHEE